MVRTNAALVEELMVWLTDCHALLAAKEKDSIPDDLTIVEEFLKEQQVSEHPDMDELRELCHQL
jgi:hypothetical protein